MDGDRAAGNGGRARLPGQSPAGSPADRPRYLLRVRLLLLVALGSALGGVARALLAGAVQRAAGVHAMLPWGTLAVNTLGALLIGALVGVLATLRDDAPATRALLVTGFCGGFTTFSAFSLEVTTLVERGLWPRAAAYAAASVVLTGLATALGLVAARGIADRLS